MISTCPGSGSTAVDELARRRARLGSRWAAGHEHARPEWGESRPGPLRRLLDRAGAALGTRAPAPRSGLRELPLALRRGEMALRYLASERDG